MPLDLALALGLALALQQDDAGAIEKYESALVLDPDLAPAQAGLAEA